MNYQLSKRTINYQYNKYGVHSNKHVQLHKYLYKTSGYSQCKSYLNVLAGIL